MIMMGETKETERNERTERAREHQLRSKMRGSKSVTLRGDKRRVTKGRKDNEGKPWKGNVSENGTKRTNRTNKRTRIKG